MRAAALLLLLVATAGCGPSRVNATNYDQTCAADTDCIAVWSGEVCAVCACVNAAINVKEKAKYDADFSSGQRSCGPRQGVLCSPCENLVGVCAAGRCAAKAH